jgi:AraC-like DNA-binding protein
MPNNFYGIIFFSHNIDKSGDLWYNTDMNKIVFAGTRPKHYEAEEHNHKCWEVIYCLEDGEVRAGKEVVAYRRGQAVVIPPLCRHHNVGAAAGDRIVHIEQGILPFKKITVISDDKNGGLFFACNQAAYYCEHKSQRDEPILSALGDLIVSYLIAGDVGNKHSPVVDKVTGEIEKKLSDPTFSLEDFLHSLPLNYDYIRKLFKSEMGVTPHDYLLGRRMALASSILKSGMSNSYSAYSISQVAESCGYAEPLYFSRVFKKYYGVSPSEYKTET